MDCPKCGESLVVTQNKAAVSVAGILSVLVIVVALLIGMAGRGNVTRMVCPACRYSSRL